MRYPVIRYLSFSRSYLLGLVLILFIETHAQESKCLPLLQDNDLPGLEIIRNDHYDGNSLWGYMNGGADIYLEYGFRDLWVQEVKQGDETALAEIYLMDKMESAFGIYSNKTFRCLSADTVLAPDCLNNYQYQAAKGLVYISVMNKTGTSQAKEFCLTLGRKIMEMVPGQPFNLPAFNNTDPGLINLHKVKMVKGPIGLDAAIPKWTTIFDDNIPYELYYIPFKTGMGINYIAEIIFPEEKSTAIFIHTFDIYLIENQSVGKAGIVQLNDRQVRVYDFKVTDEESAKILAMFGFSLEATK